MYIGYKYWCSIMIESGAKQATIFFVFYVNISFEWIITKSPQRSTCRRLIAFVRFLLIIIFFFHHPTINFSRTHLKDLKSVNFKFYGMENHHSKNCQNTHRFVMEVQIWMITRKYDDNSLTDKHNFISL